MTFGLMSTIAVLAGIAVLALGLWLVQRLRVQHREVEVLSTLFWQAAIEETRARVFVRSFRHWWAWLLLVSIASTIWLLFAQPRMHSVDGTQHVVLLDWSVDDPQVRSSDLQLAIDRAATLPMGAREIIAVGDHFETLLAAGEPIQYAAIRAEEESPPSAFGWQWAIEVLSYRAKTGRPLALHLVGDAPVDERYLESLPASIQLYRIDRESLPSSARLQTLGIADSRSGKWTAVDVAIGFESDPPIEMSRLQVTIDGQPIEQPLEQTAESEFHLRDVPADGGVLEVQVDNKSIGALTLSRREPIRVAFNADVPVMLRELIQLDPACEVVESSADVLVGTSPESNFRLSDETSPAFWIESDQEDAGEALDELIDELALTQVDATALADQSGQVIDVQVESGDRRGIAVWNSLFTPSFDFAESRACPILVARSIRWLANQPPLVPWASQGERLPVAAPEFDRASSTIASTDDGRQLRTSRFAPNVIAAAELELTPPAGMLSRTGLTTWLGLILVSLLVGEWMLYQRGRMP